MIKNRFTDQHLVQTIRTIDIWGSRLQYLILASCSWITFAPGFFVILVSNETLVISAFQNSTSTIFSILFALFITLCIAVAAFKQYQLPSQIETTDTQSLSRAEAFAILDKSSNRLFVEPYFDSMDHNAMYHIEFIDAGNYTFTILRLGNWKIRPVLHAITWLEVPFCGSMAFLFAPIVVIFGLCDKLIDNHFYPDGILHHLLILPEIIMDRGIQIQTLIYLLALLAAVYSALWISYVIYKIPVLLRNLKLRMAAGLMPDD